MKKVITFLLLSVTIMGVVSSCGKDDDNEVDYAMNEEQLRRINGLWQIVDRTEGEIISSDFVIEYYFNSNVKAGYYRVYMTINDKIVRDTKREFKFLLFDKSLTLHWKDSEIPTTYTAWVSSQDLLFIDNKDGERFIFGRAE